jgi:hypothetical protein
VAAHEARIARARGRGGGFSGVDGEGEAGFGDHVDAFVGKLQLPGHLVVEVLRVCPVVADVVGTPAAGGQFPDEVVQGLVVRVAARFGVQDGDAGVGGAVPVGVEAARVVVEEGVAGEVRRPGGIPVEGRRASPGRGG